MKKSPAISEDSCSETTRHFVAPSGVGCLAVSRVDFLEMQRISRTHNVPFPSIFTFYSALLFSCGDSIDYKDISASVGLNTDEARAAWRALKMGGFVHLANDVLVVGSRSAAVFPLPVPQRVHPLGRFVEAWEAHTGEHVPLVSADRAYRSAIETNAFYQPEDCRLAVAWHVSLFGATSFSKVVSDWASVPSFRRLLEVCGNENPGDHVAAAKKIARKWGSLKGVSGDLYLFACASIAGISPDALAQGAARAGVGCSAYAALSCCDINHEKASWFCPDIDGVFGTIPSSAQDKQ